MIELIGIEGSHEYRVAQAIKAAFIKQWPGIEESPATEEMVKIAANTKLSGYQVSDIDIVIGAVFKRPRFFAVRRPIKDRDGKSISGVKIRVHDFLAAIEVKGQDSDGISINGDEVNVRYQGKWKSATDQNVKQLHALQKYFVHQHLDAWIYRCVVLDGLSELPKQAGYTRPEAGAVASGFSAGDLLSAIAGVNGVGKWRGEYSLSSSRGEVPRKALEAPIFKKVVPSQLDSARMLRIASRRAEAEELAALLGKQRVHLRGHGGTGKTVMMMQAAHAAFEKHGRRVLVLTYNIALAADIQRLLSLLGVPASYEGGGIDVRTTMSFVSTWLSRLGVTRPEEFDQGDFSGYLKHCEDGLELIEGEAVSRDEIEAIRNADLEGLDYDAIIVDEGQDWPQTEAKLLSAIYGGERISIADGREQLLRGKPTDWSKTLSTGQVADERSLSRCLRMKKNLGIFANSVAGLAGLNWEVEPNDEAAGGRVIILEGKYVDHADLVDQLVASARDAGNEKIDFLHCVPPSEVTEKSNHRTSNLARALHSLGHETWDAVDLDTRRDFPRSIDAFRVVQYDSCRGLEGWTTVLEAFDEGWRWRYDKELDEIAQRDGNALVDPSRAATLAAWRWAMIALTRPIDTLVLCLAEKKGPVIELIREAAKRNPDFVEVLSTR
ncbi:DEAD/DEAH box helicase [Qipengyuania sp. CAU 1752]